MRPASLQPDLEQASGPERFQRVVVRHRRTPVSDDGESAIAGRVTADGSIDRAAERIGMTLHERVIDLVDSPIPERLLERTVGGLTLRHDHDACRAGIQSVHDALAFGSPAGGDNVTG